MPFEQADYVRRAFACGVDRAEFSRRFEALSDGSREAVESIAWRHLIALKLRYLPTLVSHRVLGGQRGFVELRKEIQTLDSYLLITCLDTLADRQHVDFGAWLGEREEASFSREDIAALHEEYAEEHGPGEELRRLFLTLPEALRSWLGENVGLEPESPRARPRKPSEAELMEALGDHFTALRKNPFTHRSELASGPLPDELGTLADTDWTHPTAQWDLESAWSSSTAGNLTFRMGLDEATILRLVVTGVVLAEMGLEVTRRLIEANMTKLERLHALYQFLGELRGNRALAESWQRPRTGGSSSLAWFASFRGMPLLSTRWTARLIAQLDDQVAFERGIQQQLAQYRQTLEDLNAELEAFNGEYRPLPSQEWPRIPLRRRLDVIAERLATLTRTGAYRLALEFQDSTTVSRVWQLVRDPCYTS
ncbi:MAG TPA: hypothetical protein VKA44_04125 [Gemmatimonadota bacterium]|nr:hypothetical protein [Gemmatimonadota bacterium]